MTAASQTAGHRTFNPVRPLRAQEIPMWPAIAMGFVGVGVMVGTIAANRRGAIVGAIASAVVGAVTLLNPRRAEQLLTGVLDAVRSTGGEGGRRLSEKLAPHIERYREVLATFPARSAEATEKVLRKVVPEGTHEYELGVAKEAVGDTMKMHLRGRILLEGLGGGVSWALFRQRPTVGQRLRDFGTGFMGGVLLEFPYHAFNAYFQDWLSAVQTTGSHGGGPDVGDVLAAQATGAMDPSALVVARRGESLETVRDRMMKGGYSQLPVLDADNRPIGIVHERDIFGVVVEQERLGGKVATPESPIDELIQPITGVVDRKTPSRLLVKTLRAGKIALLVDSEGRAEGVLTRRALLHNPLLARI